ncbi:hypothetical protein [Flavobacterium sp.]|uniref:hypothetical protein n=1 Tax=Flavobacterium sp. TaxID=239 RepID=UPI003753C499
MKKVFMLAALVLGTTAMVNAQTTPAKAVVTKETKHVKKAKVKAEKTADVVAPAKAEVAKKK